MDENRLQEIEADWSQEYPRENADIGVIDDLIAEVRRLRAAHCPSQQATLQIKNLQAEAAAMRAAPAARRAAITPPGYRWTRYNGAVAHGLNYAVAEVAESSDA